MTRRRSASSPRDPFALAFDSAGDLWVASYSSNTLVETMAQLFADVYGGTAAISVPDADHLSVIFPYSGS
ncbi:MAG TPA: hypothetical protein VEJ84_03795 [Acidimicrobiales bacterium]|nr:hypothetical protein [Acidimicrobiales bacterium]